MSNFCPELQLPWTLKSVKFQSLNHISIDAEHSINSPILEKDSTGQHVTDVMSFPSIRTVIAEATFNFSLCLAFSLSDELITSPTADSHPNGNTFARISSSELLKSTKIARPETVFYHYRIIFIDQVADIVCQTAPEVTLVRPMKESFTAGFLQRINNVFQIE